MQTTILSAEPKSLRQINALPRQRILSIDTFRGTTILVMIFVNEVAGVSLIPQWMKHMPADADAMTFVDVVFPAFLFIVGMSIPFAINNRLAKGDSFLQLQAHILFRTLGLLALGIFMVNAESGYYNEAAMGMPIQLWKLSFYVAAILVWNVYKFQNQQVAYVLRSIGIVALVILAFLYRGGDGSEYLQPRWWGILGLIGWAYLYTCILYQVLKGNKLGLLLMVGVCMAVYILGHSDMAQNSLISWTAPQAGNATHTAIALCGVILSLLFFDQKDTASIRERFSKALGFTFVLLLAGYALRPYYTISKIYATPTWGLYSAAICCVIFAFLYWIIDLKKQDRWTTFFQPAASNPLLIYILPSILAAAFAYTGFYLTPYFARSGLAGIIWCALYAIVLMWIVKGLNKLGIRLQL